MTALLYSDGRIGLAGGVLRAGADILLGVAADLVIPDAGKAAALAGDLAALQAASVTVATIDGIAAQAGSIVALIRELGRASQDADVAAAVWRAATAASAALQASSASPVVARAAGLGNAVAGLIEAACLGEYAVALSQGSFVDRRSALDAKRTLAADTDATLERVAIVCGEDVWNVAAQAVAYAADYLAARALDLRPIILVNAAVSLPATAAAWALYGDASRAAEIVARNRVATPALMPLTFEALAP